MTNAESLHWSIAAAAEGTLRGLMAGMLLGTVGIGLVFGLLGWCSSNAQEMPIAVLPQAFSRGGLIEALALGGAVASSVGVVVGLIVALLYGVAGGVSAGEIQVSLRPDEGIRRSARRALRGALALATVIMAYNVVGAWYAVTVTHSPATMADIVDSVILSGIVNVGVPAALLFGGIACISHFALRLVLRRAGALPLRAVKFLDYASERTFLYRVGGGYESFHGLLQDFPADDAVQLIEFKVE